MGVKKHGNEQVYGLSEIDILDGNEQVYDVCI